MTSSREWMYKMDTAEFYKGVEEFVKQADYFVRSRGLTDGTIKCPCTRCKHLMWKRHEETKYDLYKYGFVPNYYVWTVHGEHRFQRPSQQVPCVDHAQDVNLARNMVIDAAGPNFHFDSVTEASSFKPLNFEAKRFSDMLAKADEPLFEGCEKHSILSATSMMLNIKADYNMSESCYDRIMQAFKDFIPNSQFCSSFYETKKMVSHLGLGYKKIDVCPNGCMIYYMEDEGRCECYRCGHPRYKPNEPSRAKKKNKPFKYMHYLPLAPRLQRLYMSKDTAKSMTSHHENQREPGVLSHPSDGEAWKHFDRTHPSFAVEPRNVRLGLCADGFTPFGMSSASYSCWPVIVTPYNLPPWLCMKYQYMLLTLIIPGPHCPKRNIDVFLKPLIHELVQLWEVGVDTYDAFREQNFWLKATLMWTINDFPAYGMLSGWSTHGRLSCPYCMERSKAFTLKHGRKPSFFDCHRQFLPLGHSFRSDKDAFKKGRVERDEPPPRLSGAEIWRRVREYPRVIDQHYPFGKELMGFGVLHNWTKRSIFWDLSSWSTNLIRHNLDVMHVEKNVFDNIFNTMTDDKEKTKDNVKARQDVKEYCKRPELELVMKANGNLLKPKALYTLTKEQKQDYSSTDLEKGKMSKMKSHDCHVFMERLLPIAFREMLPEPIWKAMKEVSLFFRDLCSTTLQVEQLKKMEKNIVVTLCKLEKILPPGFFDHMEHLLVHLSYEARVGGPVQYRWMYPFERYLYHLKKKINNPARVESSICEAYIIEEISNFCSHYFEAYVETNLTRVGRNDDRPDVSSSRERLSIFKHPVRLSGGCKHRYLDDEELRVAILYILQNCEEIQPILKIFEAELKVENPNMTSDELNDFIEKRFGSWLRDYARNPQNSHMVNDQITNLAIGPSRSVRTWHMCFVNGFNFHTLYHSYGRKTTNTDVCVIGEEGEYSGRLIDVIELDYKGCSQLNTIVLFKCEWFDPVKNRAWKIQVVSQLLQMTSEEVNNVDMQDSNEDRRPFLKIQGKSFIPSHSVTSSITKIWKSYCNGDWDKWTKIPKIDKDDWFEEFKGMYKWDPRIEKEVNSLFHFVGEKSLRDFMSKTRQQPPTKKPDFINLTAWESLWRTWRSEEFIAKSKKAKVARQANKRPHTGGSISNVEHKTRLDKELGREATGAELFSRTHKKKGGNFVNDEAQETLEQYNEKYGEDDLLDTRSGNVSKTYSRWIDHVGVKNKSFYGGGAGVDDYILQGVDMEESSSRFSSNQDWLNAQEMLELQQTQIILLQEEQKRLIATLDVQSQKLDEFTEFQESFGESIRKLIAHEVGKEVGKVVAHEVKKVISQELSKMVAQGVGKNRQLFSSLPLRK